MFQGRAFSKEAPKNFDSKNFALKNSIFFKLQMWCLTGCWNMLKGRLWFSALSSTGESELWTCEAELFEDAFAETWTHSGMPLETWFEVLEVCCFKFRISFRYLQIFDMSWSFDLFVSFLICPWPTLANTCGMSVATQLFLLWHGDCLTFFGLLKPRSKKTTETGEEGFSMVFCCFLCPGFCRVPSKSVLKELRQQRLDGASTPAERAYQEFCRPVSVAEILWWPSFSWYPASWFHKCSRLSLFAEVYKFIWQSRSPKNKHRSQLFAPFAFFGFWIQEQLMDAAYKVQWKHLYFDMCHALKF